MAIAFDGEPSAVVATCSSCGREYPFVTAFVTRDGEALSIVHAACHTHDGEREAWLDVVVGSFEEPDFADQATFSCRVRTSGATLFAAPVAAEGRTAYFGRMLSIDEAKAHERLPDVWEIVDLIATQDETVRTAVYGPIEST